MDELAAKPAWYAEGLRFACTGCGRCCTGGDGYVWVTVDEAVALAQRVGLTVDAFGSRFLRRFGERYALIDGPDGDCVFLRGKSCSVYEERPAQCRAYPWWPANLRSAGAWKKAAAECEGISEDATLVSTDVIEPALALARAAGLAAGFSGDEEDEEGQAAAQQPIRGPR